MAQAKKSGMKRHFPLKIVDDQGSESLKMMEVAH